MKLFQYYYTCQQNQKIFLRQNKVKQSIFENYLENIWLGIDSIDIVYLSKTLHTQVRGGEKRFIG